MGLMLQQGNVSPKYAYDVFVNIFIIFGDFVVIFTAVFPNHDTPKFSCIVYMRFDSLRPSDAYMRQYTNHHWIR